MGTVVRPECFDVFNGTIPLCGIGVLEFDFRTFFVNG